MSCQEEMNERAGEKDDEAADERREWRVATSITVLVDIDPLSFL